MINIINTNPVLYKKEYKISESVELKWLKYITSFYPRMLGYRQKYNQQDIWKKKWLI